MNMVYAVIRVEKTCAVTIGVYSTLKKANESIRQSAKIWTKTGDWEEAINTLSEAIPEKPCLIGNLTILHKDSGRIEYDVWAEEVQ